MKVCVDCSYECYRSLMSYSLFDNFYLDKQDNQACPRVGLYIAEMIWTLLFSAVKVRFIQSLEITLYRLCILQLF